ncbi:MAG: hypothetical protein H7Y06_12495 [Opitutaceae bacterium]|nr:hypothetical protein [Opitutaceae bacterium]
MKSFARLALMLALGCSANAAETRTLAGTVTNTTHEATAPVTLELVFGDDDKITGWITIEKPLTPGRWPITGTRKGAWCEVRYQPTPETQVQFHGALSATEFRGTYVFGGKGELVQYGRFQTKVR